MRRLLKIAVLVALTLFVSLSLFSCNKDTTGPDVSMFTYPHPDGAEWVYKVTVYENTYTKKYSIEGTSEHQTYGKVQNLAIYQLIESPQEWRFVEYDYLQVTDNEVRIFSSLDVDDYDVLLQLPLEVGKEWHVGDGYSTTTTAKVIKTENITVTAGNFENCYLIAYTTDYQGQKDTTSIWYASGVGGRSGVYSSALEGEASCELLRYSLPSS